MDIKFNSALMLNDWIDEVTEENLNKSFKILPGILYAKLRVADWLSYCFFELAKILNQKQQFVLVNNLRKRLKYGIREELLALVELKGIGRVRARHLFRNNLRSITDLKKIDLIDLEKILGSKTAFSIKKQLRQI